MEVSCELARGPVYLAGEDVECYVTFQNTEKPIEPHDNGSSSVLAWASVQMHCFCTVSDTKVANLEGPVSRKTSTSSLSSNHTTSFQPTQGESGLVVLATKTKILFCDLNLPPGQKRTFRYTEFIPHQSPPTYRGNAVKYSYKLTIGAQRVTSKISMIRIPFRVMSVDGYCPDTNEDREDSDRLGPANPFLEDIRTKESPADIIMQTVQDLTSKRSVNYFNIANSRGKVCKFCLFKRSYKLGEDIVGTFDFSAGAIPCVQYSVSLQSIETVEKDYRVKDDQDAKSVSHNKHHEVCIGFATSHMALPIPLHLAPSFSTQICNLQYILHFEFVTSVTEIPPQPVPEDEGGCEWQGPNKLDIETMVWDLPIKLYPSFPSHAAVASQLKTTQTVKL